MREGIAGKWAWWDCLRWRCSCLPDGNVLMNELAARPHNSGHVTLRARRGRSLRCSCGDMRFPLGKVETLRPGVMTNLLGDLWSGGEPRWGELFGTAGDAAFVWEIPPAGTEDGAHDSHGGIDGGGAGGGE